jgi:hypothetical protein
MQFPFCFDVIIQADNYAISFLRGTRSKGSFTERKKKSFGVHN